MPNTWGLSHRTMSPGLNRLVRFPLPASQGSGHGGRILTYPQTLGWAGEDKRPRKDSQNVCAWFPGIGKNISRAFWSCFTFFFFVVLGGGGEGRRGSESRASQMLGKHSTIELYP